MNKALEKSAGSGGVLRKRTARKPTVFSGTKGQPDYEEFETIWHSLEFPPHEIASLEVRSTLMLAVREVIRRNGWRKPKAAKQCGVAPAVLDKLLNGNIGKLSIDTLVNMAGSLGCRVNIEVEEP